MLSQPNSNFDILKDEQIYYNQTIKIISLVPVEIYHYTRQFQTTKDYKLCTVQLNIPYTATKGNSTIARILLYWIMIWYMMDLFIRNKPIL